MYDIFLIIFKYETSTHRACTISKDIIARVCSRHGCALTFTIDCRSTIVLGGSYKQTEGKRVGYYKENISMMMIMMMLVGFDKTRKICINLSSYSLHGLLFRNNHMRGRQVHTLKTRSGCMDPWQSLIANGAPHRCEGKSPPSNNRTWTIRGVSSA